MFFSIFHKISTIFSKKRSHQEISAFIKLHPSHLNIPMNHGDLRGRHVRYERDPRLDRGGRSILDTLLTSSILLDRKQEWFPVERITHRFFVGISLPHNSAVDIGRDTLRHGGIFRGGEVILGCVRDHDEEVEGHTALETFGQEEMVRVVAFAVDPVVHAGGDVVPHVRHGFGPFCGQG